MRFLRLKDDGEFSLVEFVGTNLPPYAILSHTWGANHEEVTLNDIVTGIGKSKAGYSKIRFCGNQAAKDDLQYFWVDTCCIDKSSSAELSEAINSMFRWYQDATKCYVYLSDVSIGDSVGDDKPAFQHSRWFTRGWTLQELLAPISVDFFSVEGERLGDKSSLVQEVHKITGISVQALQGDLLSRFSVEERMSWAATRDTTREEDAAYSLLGIFDICMPLLYGEGRKKALIRLQKKITKSLKDDLPTLPPMLSSRYQESPLSPSSNIPAPRDAVLRVNAEASGFDINRVSSPHSDEEIIWHGQFRCKPGQNKDSPYVRERDELANASYSGHWREVIALLERHKVDRGEIWANCWRMKRIWGSPSGYTTLHQAAWYGASREVVQELLRLGAWRLSRTLRPSADSRTRSTPYDIARDHGRAHLYDLLCPVIRRPVDPRALQELEHKLHALIKQQFPQDLLKCFFLPELEVLTETEHSSLWFSLNPEIPRTQGRLGVHIILDHDGLVVVIHKGAERTKYHISTYMVQRINEAVVRH